MLRGGKSRSRKQRGGAPGDAIIEQEDGTFQKYTLDELKEMLSSSALTTPASPEPEAGSVPSQAVQPTETVQSGGKRKGRKATKKGGDMGAGLLTAGTLLLIQAAAKSLLAKKEANDRRRGMGRRGRPQRGGQPIESRPAAFGGDESASLVQSTLMGGSMCGAPPMAPAPQAGGKKKTKKQSGGALDTTGDLNTAFSMLGNGMHSVAYDQATAAAMPVPPFQVSGSVSQEGGKKKTKKQSGGALDTTGELNAAFAQQSVAGAIPFPGVHMAPTVPAVLTALHTQTGGRKRRTVSKSKK